jgi:HAMP domain-containing protein
VLREELEALQFEKEKMIQEAVSMGLDEIGQLKGTISALREELEIQTIEHQQKVQDINRVSRNEIGQLQQTIVSLRRELEGRSTTVTEDRNGQ